MHANAPPPGFPERVIRVFVSSTFRDMQAEREILVKRIFPQLRKLCEERAVTWTEVDLRWGISTEVAAEGKVLPLCLAEIDRCRPWFIGILGERYGWVPEEEDVAAAQGEIPRARSVTELEVLHGAFHGPDSGTRALLYFRSPLYLENLPDGASPADFASESTHAAGQLDRLKARIRAEHAAGRLNFAPRENYAHPEDLGDQVLADCTAIIDDLFPLRDVPSPLEQEAARHESFARRRRLAFVGRSELLDKLHLHAESGQGPLVLAGPSGSGKSALLAEFAARWRACHEDDVLLQHYVGGTQHASDWQDLTRRLVGEIKREFDLPEDIPRTADALRPALNEWFVKAAGARRVVVVLDGLNEIAGDDAARQLGWLPVLFPRNVVVLVSAVPGEALDVLRGRGWPELPVPPFGEVDVAAATNVYFQLFGKQTPQSLVAGLAATAATRNPLFLRTVLDELRQFGKHEELEARAEHYLGARDLPELFDRILTRWCDDFGSPPGHPDIVRRALCFISSARFGLSESEIRSLLGKPGEPLPYRHWAPIHLAIENAIVARSGLLAPGHDHLRQAISRRWLQQPQDVQSCRQALAAYFGGIATPSDRKLDELPALLRVLELWQPLFDLVCDAQVFLKLRSADRWQHDLRRSWIDLQEHFDPVEAYGRMLAHAESTDANSLLPLLNEVGRFHDEAAAHAAAESIFRRMLALAEERRSGPAAVIVALQSLAKVLIATGKLDQAEKLGRRALQIAKTSHGTSGPTFADALAGLAALFRQMDRLALAEALYCRALEAKEGSFGVTAAEVNALKGNRAGVLHSMGHFSEAEALVRSTLADEQSNLGPNHPAVAAWLGTLASILEDTNRVREAEPLKRRALRILESSYGPEHPAVATALNNLAILLAKTNRLGEAEQMHIRVLQIRERVLGSDHPSVAQTLSNLAKVLVARYHLSEAEVLYRRALRIEEAHLGATHTTVSNTLNNLASLLQVECQFAEAEQLFRRALAIRLERLGANHHLVAESHNNLALLLRLAKGPEEAEQLFRKALIGYEASFGPYHPEVAVVLCNLAGLLRSTNRLEEVEVLYRRALKIVEDSFGPDHPKVATRLNNMAVYLQGAGRSAEAEALYRRALTIRETSYGPEHPEVAAVLSNLGALLRDENRPEEVDDLFQRALVIDDRALNESHPTLALRLRNLADMRVRAKRLDEAQPMLKSAVEILLRASAESGREHPELNGCIGQYAALLLAVGHSQQSIMDHINQMVWSSSAIDPVRAKG